LLTGTSFSAEVRAAFGDLDTTYSSDGIFTDTLEFTPRAIKRQSDGKMLIAGHIQYSGDEFKTLILRRYNANGGLDASFGWNSNALPYNTFGYGLSIYIQSDGKIVVAGMFKTSEQYWQPAVWRFNANGLYDTSFGINGRVLLNSSLNSAMAVAGYRPSRTGPLYLYVSTSDKKVYCLKPNGTLETSFGTGGAFTGSVIPVESDALSVKSTGIYVSGRIDNFTAAISRHNFSGQPDTTWGSGGVVNTDAFTALACECDSPDLVQESDPFTINEENGPAVFQTSGLPVIKVWRRMKQPQYLIVGSTSFIARLNANGSFDPGFNDSCSQGPLAWNVPVYDTKLINVFADNRLVEVAIGDAGQQFVRRYTTTGLPDGSFEAASIDDATQLLPLPDGRVVVVGIYYDGPNSKIRITRHLS